MIIKHFRPVPAEGRACSKRSLAGRTKKLSISQPTDAPYRRTLSRVCSNAWLAASWLDREGKQHYDATFHETQELFRKIAKLSHQLHGWMRSDALHIKRAILHPPNTRRNLKPCSSYACCMRDDRCQCTFIVEDRTARTNAGRTFAAYPISTSQTSPLLGFGMTGLLGVIHGED